MLSVIILAAGKGTRMKSESPKVMHKIAGQPMIKWLLSSVERLDPEEIFVVVGPGMPELEDAVQPHNVVVQEVQNGTADAVVAAFPFLKNENGRVLILLGDEPFVPFEVMESMVRLEKPAVMAVRADDPTGLGRLVQRGDGSLEKIVEQKDANHEEQMTTLCNAGNFCVDSKDLERWLPQIENKNAQSEYYLTDLPAIAQKENVFFEIVEVEVPHVWGINTRTQLAEHEGFIQNQLRMQAMENGAALIDPYTVYFSWDTQLGQDVTIEPNVMFGPGVTIQDNVIIHAFSHLEGVSVSSGCKIGPFARLRPGTELKENVKIGNFVEVKKSVLHEGVKANHLGYIGDAEVGAGTNFSCGAITVNYDGFEKHQTIIGQNVMVGSNASLIAPINVGDGAFIAAGSTVSDNIPADALVIERAESKISEGWASLNREQKQQKKAS